MRKILSAVVTLLLCIGTGAHAAVKPIPRNPALRLGTLPNGLTYYILHNNHPEHRVNFYIVQRVGSIQEEERQRGLAHFLEHMCFNGTEHFPGNQVVEYLESLGVKFGPNLNAHTSIDRTIYNINDVPSNRLSALDSCLLILRDWSCGLKLDSAEIERERGVVHEEWRQRNTAAARLLERNLEKLYPGSKYGRRMPIGRMEVVDNFKPEALMAYYKKWYIPQNQAIIVVGDVNPDRIERKIRALFSSIRNPKSARTPVQEPVPDNELPIIVIDKDREQQLDVVQIMFKQPAVSREIKTSEDYYAYLSTKDMAIGMLAARLSERAQESSCPYRQAAVGYGAYLLSDVKYAFLLTIVPKNGKTSQAIEAAVSEVRRAQQHGFTATEFRRSKANSQNVLNRYEANKDQQSNAFIAGGYIEHFLKGEPIPSPDDYYRTRTRILQTITQADTQRFIRQAMPKTDRNMVIINFLPDKEGFHAPTKAQLTAAVDAGKAADTQPYIDKVKDEPLIKDMPAKGQIVSRSEDKVLGFTRLRLSNGARVMLKKTDYKKDEILFSAFSRGGSSLLDAPDFINMKLFNKVINSSGLGNFSLQELGKVLAGKTCNVNMALENSYERLTGSTSPHDLETLLQMLYLYFTAIKKDQQAFDQLIATHKARLQQLKASPDMALSDSLVSTLYAHNPRFANNSPEDIDQADYDRILKIARERTANAADFTFMFVGNYDEKLLLPLIERYIASLPSTGQRETWRNVHTYPQGDVTNRFSHKMEVAKAKAYLIRLTHGVENTLRNHIMAEMVGQLLTSIYIKKVREEASAAYSADSHCAITKEGDTIRLKLYAICPFKPEKADTVLAIMRSEAEAMAHRVDRTELDKVKAFMAKHHEQQLRQNHFWLKTLERYQEEGLDFVTDYHAVLDKITPSDIADFMRMQVFSKASRLEIIMLPTP